MSSTCSLPGQYHWQSALTFCNHMKCMYKYVYIIIFPDKEKSRKELVKTHEVFLKAVAYYKKKLHIRLRFEESRLIILHFLKILTPGCDMCSLKLSHTDGKWSCKYCFQIPTQWNGEPEWCSRYSDYATCRTVQSSNPVKGKRFFCSPKTSRPALGSTQPPIQWVLGFFPGVNWTGHEVNHSPP
jgi:hypothetical protein